MSATRTPPSRSGHQRFIGLIRKGQIKEENGGTTDEPMEAAEGKENKRRLDGQQITESDRRGGGRAYRPPLAWVDDLQALFPGRSNLL